VDVWLGDATSPDKWAEMVARQGRQLDLLLLDGVPKQTLEYLRAAEPHLAPGALVIADNAVVFAEGGMRPYLEYVRSSPCYSSRTVDCHLEWRPEVPDGLEVSTYLAPAGGRGGGEGAAAQPAAPPPATGAAL
jgi:predicted O-methyltransferase YrrM